MHRSETLAAPGLRVLLKNIIDYAGTYPPAALPLQEAVENYAQHRASSEAWLLGRMVLAADALAQLDPQAKLFDAGEPFRFSVIVGRGDDAEKFIDTLRSDLKAIDAFRRTHGDGVKIEALETKMPSALLMTDVVTVGRFVRDIDAELEQVDLQTANMFFEIPLDQNLRQTVPIATGAIHAFNRDRTVDEHGLAGLKMRTGGTEAEAFPTPASVAFLIAACRDAGVPCKATAGLHHPIRHVNSGMGTRMHGFLNVFVAAALATAEKATEEDIVSVLTDEDPEAFSFDEDGIEWRGHRIDSDTVARTRRDRLTSFGSCSFTEPVDDLRSLGLL